MVTSWVPTPELKGIDVVDSTGKVTGKVRLALIGDGYVFVTTEAHHNTTPEQEPAVVYRERDYLVSVRFQRHDDGTWHDVDGNSYDISQRGSFSGKDATKTTRGTILSALLETIEKHWTPELNREARYAHACQQLHRLEGDIAEKTEELRELTNEAAPLKAIVYEDA